MRIRVLASPARVSLSTVNPWVLLLYRMVALVYVVGIAALVFASHGFERHYPYLTFWGWTLMLLHFAFATFTSIKTMGNRNPYLEWTFAARTTVILFEVAASMTFAVMVMYWIWVLGNVGSGARVFTISVVHTLSLAVLVGELLLSRLPFLASHVLPIFVISAIYTAFNLLYLALAGSITNILRWPGVPSWLFAISALVFSMVGFFVFKAIAAARDAAHKRRRHRRGEPDEVSDDEAGALPGFDGAPARRRKANMPV